MVQFRCVDAGEIVRPFVAVYVGLYADVLGEFAIVTELNDFVNTAVERLTAGKVHVHVLSVRGNVGDDEDLGIARLTVEVAAGEQERIAVQVVQHIAMLQAAPKFLED